MNRERWQRLESIFLAALALPEEERDAFVQRESGGDAELLSELRRMLAAGLPKPGFIEPPPQQERAFEIPPLRHLGEFELLQEIGRGGMGIVFRAWQPSLNRTVAVKVLPGGFSFSAARVDRFVREARAVAKLVHPGIVTIHSVGVEGDTHYFAMEYVEGVDLGQELRRQQQHLPTLSGSSSLPDSRADSYFRRIAEVTRDVADALHHAHQNGIVHRDVKPSNLLIDRKGHVKVVDFGLARDESQGSVTRTGELAGTPYYMSPEQVRAKRHQVDHRTDVYSLGVVLFELLTLRRPFEGKSSEEIVRSILEKEAPGIRKLNHRVPRDLAVICQTAMAKDPRRRYADAAGLRDDLERFLSHQAIEARPPSFIERAIRIVRRHDRLLVSAAVGVTAIWITVRWTVAHGREKRLADPLGVLASVEAVSLFDISVERQADVIRAVEVLETEGVANALVATTRDRLRELRRALVERGQDELARARGDELSEGQREESRLRGLLTLAGAYSLFPHDEELRRLATIESAYPTVTVSAEDRRGTTLGATVFLRPVDPKTSGVGGSQRLGRTPLPPTPLLPGIYRVNVVFDVGGYREFSITPGPAFMATRLLAVRRDDEEATTAGMRRIEACEYVFPADAGDVLSGRRVALESFWLDPHEVSNNDYARFCTETGHVQPRYWRSVPNFDAFLRDYGDRPVVGVGVADADAFASWRGARLPTIAEWYRAATGIGPNQVSWLNEAPPPSVRGNVSGAPTLGASDLWRVYLSESAPVDSFEEARSPEGLFHLLGNVAEMTESVAVSTSRTGRVEVQPSFRFRSGSAWDAVFLRQTALAPAFFYAGGNGACTYVGFRCAKSAAP